MSLTPPLARLRLCSSRFVRVRQIRHSIFLGRKTLRLPEFTPRFGNVQAAPALCPLQVDDLFLRACSWPLPSGSWVPYKAAWVLGNVYQVLGTAALAHEW